ncbi:MAG TPA: hypothetical protein VKW06_19535 [Candidatus Angelobacter sp.]|nr:hypothetical protein [Candidatus Angelobacter sp.]
MIKKRFGIDAVSTPGKTGEFEVIADGETVARRGGNWFTRSFGAGYPDLAGVMERLAARRAQGGKA